MEKISVIVPVYKVEPYLDKCVQSIVNQTYQNLEIILVDDGSPDNCPAMCDAWVEKDSRIRVIHKKNGGLSDARNAGMAVASGELMGFIDSDDWVEPDMYELLYKHMKQDRADISACGVEMVWEDGRPTQMATPKESWVLNGRDAMETLVHEKHLKQPVWYKLYKTELVRDIPFAIGKCHEDVFWSYQAIGAARCVSIFDTPCYHYLQRSGSIMGEGFSLKRLDALEAFMNRINYLKIHFPELVPETEAHLWGMCLYMGQMSLRYLGKEDAATAVQRIRGLLRQYPIKIKACHGLNTKQRFWTTLEKTAFLLTCRLRNILNIGF